MYLNTPLLETIYNKLPVRILSSIYIDNYSFWLLILTEIDLLIAQLIMRWCLINLAID